MILAAYAVPHPPIIVPEIGKGEEKKIARTSAAYDAVMAEAAALHADTLVITSPHADAYVDYFAIPQERRPKAALDSLVPLRYASR